VGTAVHDGLAPLEAGEFAVLNTRMPGTGAAPAWRGAAWRRRSRAGRQCATGGRRKNTLGVVPGRVRSARFLFGSGRTVPANADGRAAAASRGACRRVCPTWPGLRLPGRNDGHRGWLGGPVERRNSHGSPSALPDAGDEDVLEARGHRFDGARAGGDGLLLVPGRRIIDAVRDQVPPSMPSNSRSAPRQRPRGWASSAASSLRATALCRVL
jgi:hypothetical protein